MIFDLDSRMFSEYAVPIGKALPKFSGKDRLVDIKCNPNKMHRLLLAYETQAIVVWSLNKDKALSFADMHETVAQQGSILASEWLKEEG